MKIEDFIKPNCNIVILTGAGISAESGIKTFRASDGLWEDHRVEDVATPEAFARDPALVHSFYNQRRSGLLSPEIKPNAAHLALAKLEAKWGDHNGGAVLVITQNIDDLHERAGSKNLIHMHGELLKMFCGACASIHGNEYTDKHDISGDMDDTLICSTCNRTGTMRPDIVWFGEMPYQMDKSIAALRNCDLFISIGTSGNVYPAAGFIREAEYAGAVTAEINLEPSQNATAFQIGEYGMASEKVPEFVTTLLSS